MYKQCISNVQIMYKCKWKTITTLMCIQLKIECAKRTKNVSCLLREGLGGHNKLKVTLCLKGNFRISSYSPLMTTKNRLRHLPLPRPSPFRYACNGGKTWALILILARATYHHMDGHWTLIWIEVSLAFFSSNLPSWQCASE